MTNFPEITSTYKKQYGFSKVWLETHDDTGHLRAELDLLTSDFRIEGITVSIPRIGLGKELLRRAEAEARQMEAKKISAIIVSAECLASMTDVFGAENIVVEHQGQFGAPLGNTVARLDFSITESNS